MGISTKCNASSDKQHTSIYRRFVSMLARFPATCGGACKCLGWFKQKIININIRIPNNSICLLGIQTHRIQIGKILMEGQGRQPDPFPHCQGTCLSTQSGWFSLSAGCMLHCFPGSHCIDWEISMVCNINTRVIILAKRLVRYHSIYHALKLAAYTNLEPRHSHTGFRGFLQIQHRCCLGFSEGGVL
jgi:hypothetical protein